MIQRIQTLYFMVALIAVTLPLFFFEMLVFSGKDGGVTVDAFSDVSLSTGEILASNYTWMLQLVLIAILILVIFLFKNRKRQMQLAWFAFGLHIISIVWILVESNPIKQLDGHQLDSLHLGVGFYIYALAVIFILLGIQGVRKDKALIDSLNRLR